MIRKQRTLGTWILQLALAVLFIVGGIWMLTGNYSDVISKGLKAVFSKDVANILRIVYGVLEIVAGVFLVIHLFVPITTAIETVLMVILLICWVVAIVLVDVIGLCKGIGSSNFNFLRWAYQFAYDMLVLGAILKVKSF